MQTKIKSIFKKFNFRSSYSLLQYWNLTTTPNNYLTVTNQPFRSTKDHKGLVNYRKGCLKNNYHLNEPEQNKEIYSFVGQAAHTGIAKQQTSHTDDETIMGQLVVPIYEDADLVGVIELLTVIPLQSYDEDFIQIRRLLQEENLTTKPM